MNLRRVGTIFRKELLDTLRDRKTLLFMVALPTLLMPGLSAVMARVTQREAQKTQERRLVVQAEPEARDRLIAFLRGRLATLDVQAQQLLGALGEGVRAPLSAIAGDLGATPFETLIRAASDPAVRDHARYAEFKAAFTGAAKEALKQAGGAAGEGAGAGGGLDAGALAAMRQVADLINPLVTIDFVDAEQAAARPATHPPLPIEELPERVRRDPQLHAAAQSVAKRQVQAWLAVPRVLDGELTERDDQVKVEMLYDSTIDLSGEAQRRLAAALKAAGQLTVESRLAREQLPSTFVAPIDVAPIDTAGKSKQILKVIAGILPYLLILMSFIGALYPATDLGAGEKERLTLETLLVSPAARSEIALGKFAVVFLAALVASLLATGSMAFTFTSGLINKELGELLHFQLSPVQVVVCLALIAPLAATFASLMLSLSLYAKSQKEAQSLMMPLQFLIIVPAMLSMIPTIELNAVFAWVPVMNVALGLRTVLTAGGAALPWTEIAIIFGSTTLLAALALWLCSWQFGREKVIFRT